MTISIEEVPVETHAMFHVSVLEVVNQAVVLYILQRNTPKIKANYIRNNVNDLESPL